MTDTPPVEEVKDDAVQEEKIVKAKKNRKLGV